ncbi:MAG: hypothetical protein WC333_02290 [Dehalococcoidia bacterium]|jgi:hypothetical protein
MTSQQTIDLISALERAREEKIRQIKADYAEKIEIAKRQYIDDNAKFKKGDFVGNVTGIIKVEEIYCINYCSKLQIVYKGIKYHKTKGFLIKNKDSITVDYLESHVKKIVGTKKLQIFN